MKKIISLFLTLTMIASLIVATPVTIVAAAETITDEALFMIYPTYLSNSEMDEGLQKAEAAYYAVINSYSKTDEIVAKAVTMLSEGVDIAFSEALSVLGITHNYYETCAKKAAKKYMQSMLQNENVLKKSTKKVQTAYKNIKTVYSTATVVAKEELIIELTKVAAENDIGISTKAMDAYVKSAYESGTLKKDLDAIGAVNDLWKYIIEFSELHAIEMTTLDMLMQELLIAGQGDSDLFIGLGLLKEDIEKDEYYILENYATKTVISLLSKFVDELIGNVTGSVHLSLIKSCIKIFCDYVYVNAKADEITQAIIQTSFVNSVDICLSKYRLKFLQGKGTTTDIETYENLYALSISARIAILDTCYDVAKITDKFSLGGDCEVWKDLLTYNYTYDNYIKWCKEAVVHDIANNELDKETGESTITDALNEETIKARLDKVRAISLYKPNVGNTFRDAYQTEGTLGFAALVFNRIFDREMGTRVESRYNHILTNNKNVRVVGRLEESDVTVSALKELFSNVRIGDILLTSGQYDYLHAMVVISVEDDGVIAYDCDSKYTPDASKDMERFEIREYKISYEKMADAFSKNGEYMSVPGISVYRGIKKVNATNSGSSLHYEEYDDSINYIIEEGVLKGYTGLRTTLEIPEGVTKIAEDCFGQNQKIKHVYMPDTVIEIGMGAFQNCQNLQTVKFSANLKEIDAVAFANCKSLYNIFLPNGLYAIWSSVFYGSGLNSIVIPDSVEIIEWYAFENCTNLKTVTVGEKVRRLYSCAFRGCHNLETVFWNSSDKGINNQFGDAFWDAGINNGGFDVVFGSSVTSIPDKALSGSDYLKSVVIPEGVKRIGKEAFYSCDGLTDVSLPESLIRIEDGAFQFCRDLKSILISKNVSYIGDSAFDYCDKIEYIYWNATEVEDFSYQSPFRYSGDESKSAKVIFGNTVKAIPSFSFSRCKWLTDIVMGENVETIGECAFQDTSISGELELPSTLTIIASAAFSHTNISGELKIPSALITIGDSAFSGTSISGSLFIPDNVTEIGFGAFNNTQITDITIPKSIGQGYRFMNFFDYCENLENIYVSPNNENMKAEDGLLYFSFETGDSLFMIPPAKTEISISTNCINVFNAYNSSAGKLEKITVEEGNKVLQVVDNILYDKEKTRLLLYPSGKSNASFSVPDGIKTIGQSTFRQSESLETITLPNSIESIDSSAFFGCENLRDVYYDGTESDWKKISIAEGNNCLINATIHYTSSNDESVEYDEVIEYAYEIPAGFNSYDEIYVPCYYAGDKVYSQVRSKNYSEANALMDIETGELVLDNVSGILSISEYSDLICYTTSNEEIFIYDLEKKSVVCELAGLGSIGYGGHFSEEGGFVLLKSDGKLHFITNDGIIGNAVDIDYSLYGDENNHVLVWGYKGEGWYQLGVGNHYMGIRDTMGLVNSDGEVVFGVSAENFRDGFAIAEKDGKYGVIDTAGKFVIPNEYENISYSSATKTYVATKDSIYYELDATGDVISTFVPDFDLYDGVDKYLGNGLAIVYNKASAYFDWKYGIVNESNEIIIPITYADIYAWDGFVENICCVGLSERYMGESIYGYLDGNGKTVISFEYKYANNFSEGLAAVCKNDKYGFVDKEGNVVIPFEYEYANDFSEGLAAVCKEDKYGFVDKEGNVVIPFEYEDATSFSDGLARVWLDYEMGPILINKNNEVMPSTELAHDYKYSLTETLDIENKTYTGGIKNNESGEVVDISHLNLLPCVLGENGQFVIGFTGDFTKAYRIIIENMSSNVIETEITNFVVDKNDSQAFINLSVVNAPADAVVYVASYDTLGKLLELQKLTLNNGTASAIFSTSSVYKYKAFIWKGDTIRPLSDPKECKLQQ